NQEIATLGLANIRLEHRDILDAGPELGTFDYVIAHGLYSWVPEPVRDKLLALAQAVLAPHGVAFVSYNALPGVQDIPVFEADIGQAEGGDFLVAGANCDGGHVEAQELGGGVLERHRDEIAAVAAPQFEDSAAVNGGGVHAEEDGEGGEAVGMSLRERCVRIQNLIVESGHCPECNAARQAEGKEESARKREQASMPPRKGAWQPERLRYGWYLFFGAGGLTLDCIPFIW